MGDEAHTEVRLARLANWSLALGLLSLAGSLLFVVLPAAIAGLGLGIGARNSTRRTRAIAGIVLSTFALIVCVLVAFNIVQAVRAFGKQGFLHELRFLPEEFRAL